MKVDVNMENGSVTLEEVALLLALIGLVVFLAVPSLDTAFCRGAARDECVANRSADPFGPAPVCPTPSC